MQPRRLAQRQLELDRQRMARFPALIPHKLSRLCASPLGFLRGAAPLFYEILAEHRDLSEGPAGFGWIQGDAHLENFGAYSPAVLDHGGWKKGHATFHLNDFDESARGQWCWDVLRLTTSLVLSGRELGRAGPVVIGLCERLLDSYVDAAFSEAPLPPQPRPVARLIERVDARSRKKLLDDRTEVEAQQRHFVRGERYFDAPQELRDQVPAALALFAQRAASSGGPGLEQLAIVDVAYRVAGTGSLGAVRLAVLTRGKGGEDKNWLFDLKEQVRPSILTLAPQELSGSRAEQVEQAFRACVQPAPRMMAASKLGELEVLVRRLTPQEDKLSLSQLKAADLEGLAAYLGALLGSAHRRGRATEFRPWSPLELTGILERAVELAGIHEAAYLELCLLSREARVTG
jgi:uncharacterized protein (DUF2252 family)